jgi:hypothetical protein
MYPYIGVIRNAKAARDTPWDFMKRIALMAGLIQPACAG